MADSSFYRGHQFTSEMLNIISASLNESTVQHADVVALMIDSLSSLVKLEVVDMKPLWDVLSDSFFTDGR